MTCGEVFEVALVVFYVCVVYNKISDNMPRRGGFANGL